MVSKKIDQPYPGLRPYLKNESDIYCGRNKQVFEIKNKLLNNKFVAIVGPSGSGKSSLINAGLIPIFEKNQFDIIEMHPGNHPIYSLSESLYQTFQNKIEKNQIQEILFESFFGLIDFFDKMELPKDYKCLINIDQFEEIFRHVPQADDENEAASFVYILEETIKQTDLPLYIVVSIRSDYIGDCMKFYDLSELITNNIFIVPRLYREQYREIIEKPISHPDFIHNAEIEPDLINHMLNDLSDNQDQLPVLQHALWLMWNTNKSESENDGKIVLSDEKYIQIGGLENCISENANEMYKHLTPERLKITTQKLFKGLINTETNREDIRRSMVSIDTIIKETGEKKEDILYIIEQFSNDNCFFIKKNIDYQKIEISHESIIRQWDRLKKWKEEEIQSVKDYRYFVERKKFLLRGYELKKANEWKKNNSPNEYWAMRYETISGEIKTQTSNYKQIKNLIKKSNITRAIMIFFSIIVALTPVYLFYKAETEKNKYTSMSFEYNLLQSTIKLKDNRLNTTNELLKKTYTIDYQVHKTRKFARDLVYWYSKNKSIQFSEQKKFPLDKNDTITTACNFSKNEDVLIIGTEKGYIIWFDLKKNQIKKKIQAYNVPVKKIEAHPNGFWVISTNNNGHIKQWSQAKNAFIENWNYNIDKSNLDGLIEENDDSFQSSDNNHEETICFDDKSSNNLFQMDEEVFYVEDKAPNFLFKMDTGAHYIAYGLKAILIRNLKTNKFLIDEPIYPQSSINDMAIYSVDKEGFKLATIDKNELIIMSHANPEIRSRNLHLEIPLKKIIYSKNGDLFGSTNKKIYFFDSIMLTFKEIESLDTDISQLVIDSKENIFAVTIDNKIYAIKNAKFTRIMDKHQNSIVSILETSKNTMSIDSKGIIEQWSVTSNFGHEKIFNSIPSKIILTPDASNIFVGTNDGKLINVDSNSLENNWVKKMYEKIDDIVLSTDNQLIAVQMNQTIIIVDIRNQEIYKKIKIDNFKQINFINTNELLAVHSDGMLTTWMKNRNGRKVKIEGIFINVLEEKMTIFDVHPDSTQFIIGSTTGCLYIVSYPQPKLIKTVRLTRHSIKNITYSTDGKKVLCLNEKNELFLINLDFPDNFLNLTFINHQAEALTAELLPGNEQIVSVTKNRKLHIWDIATASELFHIDIPAELSDYKKAYISDFDFYCDGYDSCFFCIALTNKRIFTYQFLQKNVQENVQ